MRSLIKIRNIFLYKLYFNELESIKCKLPIAIERINFENTNKVLNFRDKNTQDSFNYMLNNGEMGLYGILNNEAIAHVWCIINKNNIEKKVKCFYKTKSKIAYLHFGNVKEDFRGNNISPYLVYSLIKVVNENYNINTFYIDTDDYNLSSQKTIKKLGFKLYKKYKFTCILNHVVKREMLC